MSLKISSPLQSVRRLHGDESGLALVEFALALPLLLLLGMSAIELANFAQAQERINQIAMTVADNAGRVRDSIDENDVNEIMAGAKFMGQRINFSANGRIILSDVQNNPYNTGQWIRWQRCAGAKTVTSSYGLAGKGQTDATLPAIGPTGNTIKADSGTILMFVEIFYDYQPVTPMDYLKTGNITVHVTHAFNVRQRNPETVTDSSGNILSTPPSDIKNASSLPTSKIASCSTYSA